MSLELTLLEQTKVKYLQCSVLVKDNLDDILSFSSYADSKEKTYNPNRHTKWLINYSKDTSRKPLFSPKIRMPEFYSPSVRSCEFPLIDRSADDD